MISWCIVCGRPGAMVCDSCTAGLAPGRTMLVAPSLVVTSGMAHRGPARQLVHLVKYEGSSRAAAVLGDAMAEELVAGATALIPVPRARSRRLRYGVDPARALAAVVSQRSGVPVVHALASRWWWSSHNKARVPSLAAPGFVRRDGVRVPVGAVLVDDVATTGATMIAAHRVLGGYVRYGLVATAPQHRVSRLSRVGS